MTWPPLTDPRQALFSPLQGSVPGSDLRTSTQPSPVDQASEGRYAGRKSHKRKLEQQHGDRPVHRMPPGFSSTPQPNPFASFGHEDLFGSQLESLENFNSTDDLLQEQPDRAPESGDTGQAPHTGVRSGKSPLP